MNIQLPVRFSGERADQQQTTILDLEVAKTALSLVDCTFENPAESGVGQVLRKTIAPTLAAARNIGMQAVFLHGGDHNDLHGINLELHGTRRGRVRNAAPWPLPAPVWIPGIEPNPGEAMIEKCGQNGFRATSLDFCLRTRGVETLLCVGFSFKSCLFYTMVGAMEHNYHVVFLRDGTHPPGENEFPDTVNEALPEKGWVRLVLTRLIEDHLGYSATCADLMCACHETAASVPHRA